MILSGKEILNRLNSDIVIEPFDLKRINPNSYNIRLSNELMVYKNSNLDMKEKHEVEHLIIPEDGLWLEPHKLYLGRTVEYTKTQNLVPMLEGRCHGKGTKILMYDKTLKSVEAIAVGDLVCGIDGLPNKVISVHSGKGQMYTVNQSHGITYTVNGRHKLVLYDTNRLSMTTLSVEQYLRLKNTNLVGIKRKELYSNKLIRSDISVNPLREDYYFGFELEHTAREYSNMYFLEDLTITHNSSVGRLGLFIHVTAGFGDVGFAGYWTLELHCIQPLKVYPNVEICQIYYHTIEGDFDEYRSGKYQHNTGIQPSMLYKDFETNN